jgi:hypothetical protein
VDAISFVELSELRRDNFVVFSQEVSGSNF